MDVNLTIILLSVFLLIAAFFSVSETAFFSLQSVRVHHLVESGAPNAQRLAKLKERPERFLSTVLFGNNLCNTAITALATTLALQLFGAENQGLSVLVSTAAVTVGITVLGETAPKTLGARYPERLSLLFVLLWEILDRILFPFALGLYALSRLATRPFGGTNAKAPLISVEELRTLVRMGASEGTVEEAQAEMVNRAFRFGDLRAQEIMTPRTQIGWVVKDTAFQDFLGIYANTPHTRFPVYDESENVIGILHLQDVMKAFSQGKLAMNNPVTPLTRPAHFYPETKPVDDLFVEMRNNGTQMVLLVNEYGGIAGLLTMKQIVSEVVGRITDEEEGPPQVHTSEDGVMEVDASMRIEEASERLPLGLPEGDYDTIAGFVLTSLGHVPRVGEQVHHNGARLTVTSMKGVRIERLQITRTGLK